MKVEGPYCRQCKRVPVEVNGLLCVDCYYEKYPETKPLAWTTEPPEGFTRPDCGYVITCEKGLFAFHNGYWLGPLPEVLE